METFLTAEQVAAIVHCGPRKVLRARQAGELSGTRAGKSWVFSESAVKAWIDLKTTPVTVGKLSASLATRRRRTAAVAR